MCDLTRMERRHPPTFTISAAISILKYGGKEQMQMDENNDKMRYTLESEDEMAQPQPMQSPAQPETAEPEACPGVRLLSPELEKSSSGSGAETIR